MARYENSSANAFVCDFDGTLAPIINDPTQSKIPQHIVESLLLLTQKIEIVAVISGRELEFLNQAFVPHIGRHGEMPIKIFGLYGSQTNDDNFAGLHRTSGMTAELKKAILQCSTSLPEKIYIEVKDNGVVFHYRNSPDLETEVLAMAEEVTNTFPVRALQGKKVIELVPADQIDKGDVIDYIGNYADAICYIGDDYGDIAAFESVNKRARSGLSIGVFSEEMPIELYQKCQFILESTQAVHQLTQELLFALS
ncbi:MAG: trehalose-phosphatase [Firmicutes bacterium]|nr:trehalose-phosphatase [Bacillota bacterium]